MVAFYLGCPEPAWLRRTDVRLFVSHNRLRRINTYPRATCTWALDSGGFTQLEAHGTWQGGSTPIQYMDAAERYHDEIGGLDWIAPQDWMCEPFITAKTGLTVSQHQVRTVANFLELRGLSQKVHVIPVIQGWTLSEYMKCIEMYDDAGVDLRLESTVGLGSVCRRQDTGEIAEVVGQVSGLGIHIHGFGVKVSGLRQFAGLLTSADSQSWSKEARIRKIHLEGCRHQVCNYCLKWALQWRSNLLARCEAA